MADGRPPDGIGRGRRGALLLAAYKAKTQQNVGVRPAVPEQQSQQGDQPRVIGWGTGSLMQNLIAGRGCAALPGPGVAPPTLGRGVGSLPSVTFGRGALPLRQARILPSSSSQFSALPTTASPSTVSVNGTSSTSPPVTEFEELTIGKYSGTSRTKQDLEVNYIPLKISEDKGIFEYHVTFEPIVDSKQMCYKIMDQPDVRAIIGPVRSFDGAKLHLPIKSQQELFVNTKLPSDNSNVTVCIKYVGVCKTCDRLHLYNVLFRKIMNILKLVQVDRNYFNPQGGIPVPQHRLEIWPGYICSSQEYEGGIMLHADASFKVLRSVTAMEIMKDIMGRNLPDMKEEVCREIIGAVVLTRYNNRSYRVDNIAWDKNPLSTFTTHDNREITFADYYKRAYEIKIRDLKQPLLLSQAKKKNTEEKERVLCLVPELCNMTGLTDNGRSDQKMMRDIATHTPVNPSRRQDCFLKFVENVSKTPEASKILKDWYLELDDRLLNLQGRALPCEEIKVGNKMFTVQSTADWHRDITNAAVPVNLNNWFIVYTKQDSSEANEFIRMLKRVGPDVGIRVNHPRCIEIMNDNTETYCQSLRNNINPEVQLAVIIFPNLRDDQYSAVQRVCCLELPIPSQCLNVWTISQQDKIRSVTQKIALQINCKLGGELLALNIPMQNIMVCGLDVYHDAAQCSDVIGFVASINCNLTRWFSKTATQKAGQELGDALKVFFISALKKYHDVNHKLPQKIFLYRNGVGDDMLDYVAKYEVEQLVSCFPNIQLDYCPTLSIIVMQTSISTRMLRQRNRQLENPPPGTVLDHTVTRKGLYDFFIVGQHVGQATVTPTHFIVVHDSSSLKPEYMQRLTYKLTRFHYNLPGTVKVPVPCHYAHCLAHLVGQYLHKEVHEALADKLFYL